MKLTILIITVCLVQVSALTKAQITIIAKQESLRNVLEKISQQSGYDFIYSVQDFKNANPVDLKLNNVGLEKALSAAFYGQPLIYEVSDKTVMVKKREEKSYLETIIDRFQAIDVRGKVVDSLGVGIAGATVSIKDGKGSTSTSANGDFYLKNVEEGAVLVISFMGYVTKEQVVSKDFNYVILKQSTSQLDEVLVQAYGTTTRRLSTGNIAMITSKEISQQNINNPLLALQGRVAGVEVTPLNGLPGAPVTLRNRGDYSFGIGNGDLGNEPLIVIDGVPQANNITGLGSAAGNNGGSGAGELSTFGFINPNEIESISVLKDADATSIYGSRGSKGVIVITTKKGKAGQTSVDFTVNSGWQEVSKKLHLLNTEQYVEMRREGLKNANRLARLDNPAVYAGVYPDLLIFDQHKYTDWQEVLLGNTARYSDVQGAIAGGTQNIQYRLGGTFHNETYVFPGNNYDRKGSAKISVTGTSPNQQFKAILTAEYLFNKNRSPVDFTKQAVSLAPNAPDLYLPNGELNWQSNPYSPDEGGVFSDNPIAFLKKPSIQNINTLTASSNLTYEILPGLVLKAAIGYTKLDGNSNVITSNLASTDPAYASGYGPYLRIITFRSTGTESWSTEPQLTYSKRIGKGQFHALIGGALQKQSTFSDGIEARGFNSDAVMRSLSLATEYANIENSSSEYRYSAVFARINYNWADKYLVNLSGRRDGSSRFGPARQFGNFWSVGTAWIFTNEKVIQSLSPSLSFGKIRFSYGTSGNDGIGDYKFMELYTPETSLDSYRGFKILRSVRPTNAYYGWETVKKLEIGLDLGFFKDKLNLSSAFFRNRSSNILGPYLLPGITGTDHVIANRPALTQTQGWEFSANTQNIKTLNFSWNTSLNIGFISNKLLADYDGDRAKPGLGQPFYGRAGLAIFNGVDPMTGQYQFKQPDGSPTFDIDLADKTFVRTDPSFSGGISNNFNYKNFSLNFFFQFIKQNGRNYLFQFSYPPGQPINQPLEVMDRWTAPGDISSIQRFSASESSGNPVPEVTLTEAYNNVRDKSSAGWVDASFIRLKTIAISYSLPDVVKRRLHAKNVSIFMQGQNVFTWTGYKGSDPQTQNPSVLPPLRTITAGLQFSL